MTRFEEQIKNNLIYYIQYSIEKNEDWLKRGLNAPLQKEVTIETILTLRLIMQKILNNEI